MKRLSLILAGSLALCGAAFAEEKAAPSGSSGSETQKSDKMKGPPNADGAGKADTTGTSGGGAAAAKSTGEAGDGAGKKK